ncbi:MAG: hypothetical protein WCP08_09705, partial [Prolixibacteraceae bacterium]
MAGRNFNHKGHKGFLEGLKVPALGWKNSFFDHPSTSQGATRLPVYSGESTIMITLRQAQGPQLKRFI